MDNKIPEVVPFKVSADGKVLWIEGKDIDPNESMFRYDRYIKTPARLMPQTDLDTLLKTAARLNDITPAGLIFHVGRCGSTLLSNALEAVDGTLVLSEPHFISSLFKFAVDSQQDPGKTAAQLKAYINILSAVTSNKQNGVYLKFTSWNSLLMDQIRMIYPNTPVAFAFRNPLDVFDSMLIKKVGWMGFYGSTNLVNRILNKNEGIEHVTYIDFVVRFLTAIYKSGLNLLANDLLISYGDQRTQNIEKLLSHFNLTITPVDSIKIEESTRYYSKSRDKKRLFIEGQNMYGYTLNEQTKNLINASGIHEIYQKLQVLTYKSTLL